MRATLRVVTPPKVLPLSLAQAKRHLGLSSDDHDTDLESLIRAAANELIKRSGIALTKTTFAYSIPCWPGEAIELPYPPLVSIATVNYRDFDGVVQELVASKYQLEQPTNQPARITRAVNEVWPSVQAGRIDGVVVTYDAGTDDLEQIPPEASTFLRHWVRQRFDNPDGTVEPLARDGLSSLARSLWTGSYIDVSPY